MKILFSADYIWLSLPRKVGRRRFTFISHIIPSTTWCRLRPDVWILLCCSQHSNVWQIAQLNASSQHSRETTIGPASSGVILRRKDYSSWYNGRSITQNRSMFCECSLFSSFVELVVLIKSWSLGHFRDFIRTLSGEYIKIGGNAKDLLVVFHKFSCRFSHQGGVEKSYGVSKVTWHNHSDSRVQLFTTIMWNLYFP